MVGCTNQISCPGRARPWPLCSGGNSTHSERAHTVGTRLAHVQRVRKAGLKREKKQLDEEIALYFSLIRKVNPGLYARLRVLKDGSLAVAPAVDAGAAPLPKPRVSRRRRKSPRKPVRAWAAVAWCVHVGRMTRRARLTRRRVGWG